ncbi:MAG TPA: hypothetical protein VD704_04900 [Gaiellaceae bacterium]|nr:hypothetical protein [Gaiellaceae bacterium]
MHELEPDRVEWRRLDDDLRLAAWRAERLLALGYPLRRALSLATSGVDIHELERLIGRGCPPETAVRIAA